MGKIHYTPSENLINSNYLLNNKKKIIKILLKYKPKAIFNLAAETHVDRSIDGPIDFVNTNIVGTYNILEASLRYFSNLSFADKNNFKLVHISTDEVFGSLGENDKPFTEESTYRPNSPYSASKASSDHLVRSYYYTYGLPILLSNCSNNYGPAQHTEKLVPLMIQNIINQKPLPVYGKGENIRDWLYVEDHAKAIDTIFHKGKLNETYNIGGFNEWKNIDLIKLIIKITDRLLDRKEGSSEKLITYVRDREGHDLRYAIDATKLKNELGWEPSLQFEKGIEKTVKWYLNNKH